MWQIVRELVAGGVTIFLTTQYLEEADELADRIAVLEGGKLVAEGTAEELKRRTPGGHVQLQFTEVSGFQTAQHVLGRSAHRDGDALTLRVPNDGSLRELKALLDRLDEKSIEVGRLSVHTPDLDDVFLALTEKSNNEKVTTR
jgi:ABC-2 type transport system ATP-binding protein